MKGLQENKIAQAWLVLVLALLFGGSLGAVQLTLGPVIEINKINETRRKVPELVDVAVEDRPMLTVEPETIDVVRKGKKSKYSVYRASLGGRPVGWVAKVAGQGYADKIELLVGFDYAMDTITGLFVLNQKETPGLGNKITELSWRGQFKNKSTGMPLVVVKTEAKADHEIDAITGATISSRSVAGIINAAAGDLRAPLSGYDNNAIRE